MAFRATVGPLAATDRDRSALRPGFLAVSAVFLLLATLVYAAAPLAALWSVGVGLHRQDAEALRQAMDWRAVRSALKTDLGGSVHLSLASARVTAPAEEELPGFGESFATTVVAHAVDDEVTPERIVALLGTQGAAQGNSAVAASQGFAALLARVQHVCFVGPARFDAAIRMSDDPAAEPIRVSMRLRHWHWKITRIHVPDSLFSPGTQVATTAINRT